MTIEINGRQVDSNANVRKRRTLRKIARNQELTDWPIQVLQRRRTPTAKKINKYINHVLPRPDEYLHEEDITFDRRSEITVGEESTPGVMSLWIRNMDIRKV